MNTYVRDLWLTALTEYPQATASRLRSGDAFCVGGVLCDLHSHATGKEWVPMPDGSWTYLGCGYLPPVEVLMWAQLSEDDLLPIMGDNDNGFTFPELAPRIMAL